MLLSNTYQQFLKHTDLTDSTYKAVFIQISDILEKVSNTYFTSLTYIVGDNTATWDFTKQNEMPHYVVEILKNMFEQFYTLPQNSKVSLCVTHNDMEYTIESNGDTIIIPEDIMFIKKYDLCTYFINDHIVQDPFTEFNKFFNFIYIMCKEKEQPIKELHDIFKNENMQQVSIFNNDAQSIDDLNSLVCNIKKIRKEALQTLGNLKTEKEALNIKKLGITSDMSDRNSYIENKYKVDEDLKTIQYEQKMYDQKIDSTKELINTIDKELLAGNTPLGDLDYLKEKKHQLTKTLDALLDSQKQVSSIATSCYTKAGALKDSLAKYSNTFDLDYKNIVDRMQTISDDILMQESLITNYESQLVDLYNKLNNLTAPSAQGTAPEASSLVLNKLNSTGYSKPIVIVLNYLKNLFVYNASNITNQLLHDGIFNEYPSMEAEYAQTIAMRFTLTSMFNMYFKNTFSFIAFADDRYTHVIKIVRG